jgi:hypothetical protein
MISPLRPHLAKQTKINIHERPNVYMGMANVGVTPLDRLKSAADEIKFKQPHELFNIPSPSKLTY